MPSYMFIVIIIAILAVSIVALIIANIVLNKKIKASTKQEMIYRSIGQRALKVEDEDIRDKIGEQNV